MTSQETGKVRGGNPTTKLFSFLNGRKSNFNHYFKKKVGKVLYAEIQKSSLENVEKSDLY